MSGFAPSRTLSDIVFRTPPDIGKLSELGQAHQGQDDLMTVSGKESSSDNNITDKNDSESSDSDLNEIQKAAIQKVKNL
jgi:hypothetical protein